MYPQMALFLPIPLSRLIPPPLWLYYSDDGGRATGRPSGAVSRRRRCRLQRAQAAREASP